MRDGATGLLLALVGIGILVAWRMGAFNALLSKTGEANTAGKSAESALTGLLGIPDRLRATPPATSTVSPQSRGAAGQAEDGFTSTYAPLTDPWGPGGYLDESTRARNRARVVVAGAEPITDALVGRSLDVLVTAEKTLGLDSSFWFPQVTRIAPGSEGGASTDVTAA